MLKKLAIKSCIIAATTTLSFCGQNKELTTKKYKQKYKVQSLSTTTVYQKKLEKVFSVNQNRDPKYKSLAYWKRQQPFVQKYIALRAQLTLQKFLITAYQQGQPLIDADYNYIFYLTHALSPNKVPPCNIPVFALSLIVNEEKSRLTNPSYYAYVLEHLKYLLNFIVLMEEKKSHLLTERSQCATHFYLNDLLQQQLDHVQDPGFLKHQLHLFRLEISNPTITQKQCFHYPNCFEYAAELNTNYLTKGTTPLLSNLSRWS